MINYTGKCICGVVTPLPPTEQWLSMREQVCSDPECVFLDRCEDCRPRNFLSRFCRCDCDNCTIVEHRETEVEESNDPGFGLTGVSRIPKGERWNPALGEYCRTTGDVEKYRKEQGKVYVSDDEAPVPYEPSSSEESKKKRREFAREAVGMEVKGKDE